MSATERRQLAIKSYPRLCLSSQCELLDVTRSLMYYKPKGESPLNEPLMKYIDPYFLIHPYYGVERMTDYLNKDLGYHVNEKRIRRLYNVMNLKTIYARPSTTKHNPESTSTLIYFETLRPFDRIKYGKLISPTFRCSGDLCVKRR